MTSNINPSSENITSELRRGVISIAVLSQLVEAQYGYSLLKHLTELGLEIDQGTLYPLLRRLESQGLLESDWRIEDERPRLYYILSAQGKRALSNLTKEWKNLVDVLDEMLQ